MSRVEPSAEDGVQATISRLWVVSWVRIDEILVDDAAHAVIGAIDPLHLPEFARFQNRPDQRLVDDGGRAAALGDENLGEVDGGHA